MQFLHDIREKIDGFEFEQKAELHRFIDYLHTIFKPPGPAIPAPVAEAPVAEAPVAEAPVAEATPVDPGASNG